jgi:hypothetical protein
MRDAVVLLMHQGNSFTEELKALLDTRNLVLVAISSQPPDPSVFEKNKVHLDDWVVTDRSELTGADVTAAARRFAESGYRLRAAIATFEGYRLLMADLNQLLGARDSSRPALELSLHKFRCREFLSGSGLSKVVCRMIRSGNGAAGVRDQLDRSRRWFVKPVRGAASFGCFILEDGDDLHDISSMQNQMHEDQKLSSIFMGQFDFFAEEYVEGPEFSFEIVAADRPRTVCIHEKARVERLERTTLENMSISPPIGLPDTTLLDGVTFVSDCLTAIGLTSGAFHVEMKYWQAKQRWEIIEINPRMGGSLINASTERVTGMSILELWLDSLLLRDDEALAAFHACVDNVSQIGVPATRDNDRATVFLSKYGARGKTVESIRYDDHEPAPNLLHIHVKPGTVLADSDRAICVMDALWEVSRTDLARSVDLLERLSDEHFHISYL